MFRNMQQTHTNVDDQMSDIFDIKNIFLSCQKLAAGDFKANTGEIIHDILGAANKVIII